MRRVRVLGLLLGCAALMLPQAVPIALPQSSGSCFLLTELGVGEVRRNPSTTCTTRMSPASTYKIPHALAALDAGVVANENAPFKYDGSPVANESWRRDHTLASAMQSSVLWYFQRIAQKLGTARERWYLERFKYGNADPSSSLTTFWLGGSLQISPEEQQQFLLRLFAGDVPVKKTAIETVRKILIQPQGAVVNATGHHSFNAPWPADLVLRAKTGAAVDRNGRAVRWLVGHVERGSRSWTFVANVVGGEDLAPLAAVDLAARSLREAHVF